MAQWAGGWGGQQQQFTGSGGGNSTGWGATSWQQGNAISYGQQQQQHAQAPQQQPQQQGGWGAATQPSAQQQAQPARQNGTAAAAASTLHVSGCTHATVGVIVRGTYQLTGENHGKPAYKRDGQVSGLDVRCYFWDERDGPSFSGWWFGPVIGGDQVWAYHADKTAPAPPTNGWQVPYDGPVDPSLIVSSKPVAASGGWDQPQQNNWQQQQLQQQQQQQQQMQQAAQALQQQQQRFADVRQQQQMQQMEQLRNQQQMQQQLQQKRSMQPALQGWQGPQGSPDHMQRLMENRKRLEESNKKKLAEKQAAIDAQKKAREDKEREKQQLVIKQQEDIKKRHMEQQSAIKIRRVIAKYKLSLASNIEAFTKELEDTVKEELEKLVFQKEIIEKELAEAREYVKTKLEALEKKRIEDEEKKKAEEEKKKAMRAKSEELVKELDLMVEKLEALSSGVVEEAEPFTKKEKEMSIEEIQSVGKAVEEAGREFTEKHQACKEFVESHGTAIKNTPHVDGEAASTCSQDYLKLLTRMNISKHLASSATNTAATAQQDLIKKASAKKVLEKKEATFKKYDSDKDGMLSRRELMAFSKGEYRFALPSEAVDLIFKVLAIDGDKGVRKANLHRLTVMIGLAREKALDDKRREKRLAEEQRIADLKAELEARIAETSELAGSVQEEILKAEKQLKDLPGQTEGSTAEAAEMRDAADKSEVVIKAAAESVSSAMQNLKDLETVEVEEELKAFLASSIQKLTTWLKLLNSRVTGSTAALAAYRSGVGKKETAELEAVWAKALRMLRHHRSVKKLDNDGLFAEVDRDKDGKIDESELVKFLQTCEKDKTEKDGEEPAPSISEEDLSRLFAFLDSEETGFISKESFLSMIRHFMKVVKATVISDCMGIKGSKVVRRLEPDDVVEVLQGPITEADAGICRLQVKVHSDGKEGWLTPVGNQGTVFLEEAAGKMKVMKETILTGSFALGGKDNKATKKLSVGEIVYVQEWGRKEPTSGLTRTKVKLQSGEFGWVTSIGNTGIVFLEMV